MHKKARSEVKPSPFNNRGKFKMREDLKNQYEISETNSSDNENLPSMLAILKNQQVPERKFLSTLAAPATIQFFNKV